MLDLLLQLECVPIVTFVIPKSPETRWVSGLSAGSALRTGLREFAEEIVVRARFLDNARVRSSALVLPRTLFSVLVPGQNAYKVRGKQI